LLLVLVNAFVGAMIGLEQTVVPLLGKVADWYGVKPDALESALSPTGSNIAMKISLIVVRQIINKGASYVTTLFNPDQYNN
jgi:hypothetical protein